MTDEAKAKAGGRLAHQRRFFDIENDGDLDLFVCNYVAWSAEIDRGQNFQLVGTGQGRAYGPPTAFGGTLCVLLRNDGGKFTDVSEASGIQVRTPDPKAPVAKSLGVAPLDIDGDGWSTSPSPTTPCRTSSSTTWAAAIRGDRDHLGGRLRQSGSARGAMGIDWADFKNDGSLGLAIGNFANEMTALYVTDEPATLQFSDLANLYGLGAPTQPPLKFGLFFFDYDLDGRLDLLSANGHLESEIAKVQASRDLRAAGAALLERRQARPDAVRAGRARERRARPLPPHRRPGQRLRRHRRRRRPRRRPDRQRRPRPPLPQRRGRARTTGSASS